MVKSLKKMLCVSLLTGILYSQLIVKTVGTSGYETGNSFIRLESGNFIIVGNRGNNILLTKVNSSFNPIWSKEIGGDSIEYGYSVIQTSDKNVVLTGRGYDYNSGASGILISKFDTNGNHIWSRLISYPNLSPSSGPHSIIEIQDGSLYVVGSGRPPGEYFEVFLSKFDANGNHLWSKTIGGGLEDYSTEIISTSDNGLLIVGVIYLSVGGHDHLLVLKLSREGALTWYKAIYEQNIYGYEWINGVIQSQDDGFVIVGATRNPTISRDIFIAKLDMNGNIIWSKALGSIGTYSDAYSVIQLNNGNFVLIGTNGNDLILSSFDQSGNHLWTKSLGEISYQDGGKCLLKTNSGNTYFLGSTRSYGSGNYDIIIGNFDQNGNICIGTAIQPTIYEPSWLNYGTYIQVRDQTPDIISLNPTITNVSLTSVTLCLLGEEDKDSKKHFDQFSSLQIIFCPVFFDDKIILKFEGFYKNPLGIFLYNSSGVKLLEYTYAHSYPVIELKGKEIKNLKKGVYFLRVYSGKREIGSFKIVK